MRTFTILVLSFLFNFTVFSQDFTFSDNGLPCARNAYTFTPTVAVAFDSLVWDFGDGNTLSEISAQAVDHSFIAAGIYSVKMNVYRGDGIIASPSHNVTVYDKPNLTFSYSAPSLVCAPNDSVILTVDTLNIEPPDLQFTIDWGDKTQQSFNKNEIGKPKTHRYQKTSCGNVITIGNSQITDKFLITISATNRCTSVPVFLFKPVDIKSAPNVGFSIENTSYDSVTSTFYVCDSNTVLLKNDSYGQDNCLSVDNVIWQVYDQNNQIVNECINSCLDSYTMPFPGFGKYKVVLTQDNTCGSASVERYVEFRKPPEVRFRLKEPAYCYPAHVTFLNISSDDVVKFWWDFIGDSSQVIVDTVKVDEEWLYTESGIYNIKLWGTDNYCMNSFDTTLDLTKRCKDIYVPNAFIPTSDNPDLKVFKPKAKDLVDYRIDIYDLYGKHIWSSTALDDTGSPSEGWDGTCPNGTPCPPGTYIWKIKATLSYGDLGEQPWDGQVYNKKGKRSTAGTVVLIRQ